ncbi:MAG: divalent metal cation transporter, partial [Desulfovibrionaceae bacterium]|nr:divalent metal cation transporter [Desulfovibrionaceae bacterium]
GPIPLTFGMDQFWGGRSGGGGDPQDGRVRTMLTAAVTLNMHGVTDIQTSVRAAQALWPLAGEFAFLLFAAGIVGSGLLAAPILAGSSANAVAEALGWPIGLGRQLMQAKGFYAIVAVATLLGVALNFTPVDPIKALFWSAVINGVTAVPIMAVIMFLAARSDVMGRFVIKGRLKVLGWLATAVMAPAALVMAASWAK